MLVLKRKSLEEAIKRLENDEAAAKKAAEKKRKEELERFKKRYDEGLKLVKDKLKKQEEEYRRWLKDGANPEELNRRDFETSFSMEFYANHFYPSAADGFPSGRMEKVAVLKGLLNLIEGDEVQLTNALAEKLIGKTDILALLN